MKFLLRKNVCSPVGHSQVSLRRGSSSTQRRSGGELAGALLAAMAVAAMGCSGAEASDSDGAPGADPDAMNEAQLEMAREGAEPESSARAERGASASALDAERAPAAAGEEAEEEEGAAAAPAAVPSEGSAAGEGTQRPDEGGAPEAEEAPVPSDTMRTSGRQLLDTCGNPFVTRGVEQIFGNQLPQGNDWNGLLEQIAASGVNAVRILAGTDTLGVDDVDRLLDTVAEHGMVAYVTPYGNDNMRWLEGEDVRAMLKKHEKYILIDAFGEPTFDDRAKFLADSTSTIRTVRGWGYEVPLTVTANQFGRDLPSLFELGEQIIAADPLHNTVLGWQAYWSNNNYYQEHYGFTLTEAVDAIAASGLPIQLGLDRVTDFPSDATADFGTLMAETERHGVGWLWWDWFNPYGNENNLTHNGTATDLTPTGDTVLNSHAASVKNTAERVCVR